jgi:hypothetical protein
MDATWRTSLLRQYGRAIDVLESAMRDCPEELWGESIWEVKPHHPGVWPVDAGGGGRGVAHVDDGSIQVFSAFWYVAYHALFFLDFHLSGGEEEGFAPPAPFMADEHAAGVLPQRVYTRAELQNYLAHNRLKCQATIEALTADEARRPTPPGMPFAELLLSNMRHVQEHGAQLNMFLGQRTG